MTGGPLRERLAHLVTSIEDDLWTASYPAAMDPTGLGVLGSVGPLRRLGGHAAAQQSAEVLAKMPPGWVDVWLHQRADQRREDAVLLEAGRRDVDASTFDASVLDHAASWDMAQLDPPKPGEQPACPEHEARAVALAALKHEGLPPVLLGKHLLFCRYTCLATRHQPVWLALFEQPDAPHLIVINADSDRLLQPVS